MVVTAALLPSLSHQPFSSWAWSGRGQNERRHSGTQVRGSGISTGFKVSVITCSRSGLIRISPPLRVTPLKSETYKIVNILVEAKAPPDLCSLRGDDGEAGTLEGGGCHAPQGQEDLGGGGD